MVRLSVIVPVYDTAATLESCVKSVLAGGEADCEVILADDGSRDGSAALCDGLAATDARVRVVHLPHGGLSAARNAALDLCRGRYVTFADSDDWIAPGAYPPLLDFLDRHADTDIVEYPACLHCDEAGRGSAFAPEPRTYHDWRAYWLGARGYAHAYAWNKVYRRHLFGDIRFPVGKNFEDVWTMPLLLCRARGISTADSGRYYYRANPTGITARASATDLRSLLEAHLRVLPLASDATYYAHVLNIALDVYRATGKVPALPAAPCCRGLKPLIARLFGLRFLCQIHSLYKRLHW